MNAYKSRLLAEARGDVGRALDIALARMAVLDACVSGGFVRAGASHPIERISGEFTGDEANSETPDTDTAGRADIRHNAG